MLRLAIQCFLQQTYPQKELIVLYNVKDFQTRETLSEYTSPMICPVELDTKGAHLSIGELRNISIEASKGKYLCTWDDDDWSAPDRIQHQLETIQKFKKRACVLNRVLLYHAPTKSAYLSLERTWEFSILYEKSILKDIHYSYPSLNRSEDAHMMDKLNKENFLVPLLDPTLYIYQATGFNTCEKEHFDWMNSLSQKLSPYQTLIVQKALGGELSSEKAHEKMQSDHFLRNLRYVNP